MNTTILDSMFEFWVVMHLKINSTNFAFCTVTQPKNVLFSIWNDDHLANTNAKNVPQSISERNGPPEGESIHLESEFEFWVVTDMCTICAFRTPSSRIIVQFNIWNSQHRAALKAKKVAQRILKRNVPFEDANEGYESSSFVSPLHFLWSLLHLEPLNAQAVLQPQLQQ